MAPGLAANYSAAEASHIVAQAGPGTVYIKLKREFEVEQAGGIPIARMFTEMTVSEARVFQKLLGEVIGTAAAAGSGQPSGMDGGARL